MQATPQVRPGLGALARLLSSADEFARRPFGYPNPPVALLSDLLGVPGTARTLERLAYGEPLTTGRGMATRVRDDTVDAVFNAPGPLAAVARATKGLPVGMVIKPKGGNWLAGSVENAVKPLKNPHVDKYAAELERLGSPEQARQWVADPGDAERALNQWIDKKLAGYIRNEMATPEDPVRALAERGISHVSPEHLAGGSAGPDVIMFREMAGLPTGGMGKSDVARDWENLADQAVDVEKAGSILRNQGYPNADRAVLSNPWLKKVPPETTVYSLDPFIDARELGFSHLVDELRNAVNPESGLPRELLWKYADLNKVTVPQAVQRVHDINQWRVAQAEVARKAAREGIPVHKQYPEGYQWTAVPDLAKDKQALQYATDVGCEGGWCTQSPDTAERYGSGGRQLYVLHDPKGKPVVQVATRPGRSEYDAYMDVYQRYPKEYEALLRRYSEQSGRDYNKLLNADNIDPAVQAFILENSPYASRLPSIVEIKGRFNKAPDPELLPYVQDFVRSQPWSDVGDAKNAGLRRFTDVFNSNELRALQEAQAEAPTHGWLSGEEIQRLHNLINPEGKRLKYDLRGNIVGDEAENFARGGAVSAAPYDSAKIESLAAQLAAELAPA